MGALTPDAPGVLAILVAEAPPGAPIKIVGLYLNGAEIPLFASGLGSFKVN